MQTTFEIANNLKVDHKWLVSKIKGHIEAGEELGETDSADGFTEKYGNDGNHFYETTEEANLTIFVLMQFEWERRQGYLLWSDKFKDYIEGKMVIPSFRIANHLGVDHHELVSVESIKGISG